MHLAAHLQPQCQVRIHVPFYKLFILQDMEWVLFYELCLSSKPKRDSIDKIDTINQGLADSTLGRGVISLVICP
jgi:hypothetical protein